MSTNEQVAPANPWEALKTAAEAEYEKVKAAVAGDVAKLEAIADKFVPVVAADFDAFVSKFAPVAAASVVKLMGEEFDAITGAEKQSTVVTDVVSEFEAAGKAITEEALNYARTLAANAYTEVAKAFTTAA